MQTTGELLGSGRSADVYVIDGEWVLRRSRQGTGAASEAALMKHLARHGYPVPDVDPGHPACAVPATDLVMRRLSGRTMAQAMADGSTTAEEGGAALGRLLRRLHSVPAPTGVAAMEAGGPSARILHLDLHPENVLLTADGPVVIDWTNARLGQPALDWAMSALILSQVALESPLEVAVGIRRVLAAMLAVAGSEVDVVGRLPQARARRADDPGMSADEIARLDEAVAFARSAAGSPSRL
ncbi:aminoglycoside phosphotransferase family protein [Streptomyces kurssanovii]|uniref:Aminoglycoside phosphotransferase family protein n=1 Tax=Streptomyces kurssanovii TaxID=67312 RepID=A0ABV3HQA0_9ACTN